MRPAPVRTRPVRVAAAFTLLSLACVVGCRGARSADGTRVPALHTLAHPFSAEQQERLPFGERSHWLQPWRAYPATVPARRLIDGLGIVFNPPPSQAQLVAHELAAAGFHRARIEIPWCRVSYRRPERLTGLAGYRETLLALRRNHLRPLVLLNANHGCPGPLAQLRIRVVAPALAGARELQLDAASAAKVVPGHTGLDSTTEYKAAAFLFTAVKGNTVTLAKPLDRALEPGTYAASTLRYVPFTRPGRADFAETMAGWLRYVGLVTRAVKRILGDERFDVEVWNELSFGSDFLDVDTYYDPALVPDAAMTNEAQILRRTVAYIRNPRNGVSRIGIGDGFASERPWEAGSTEPAGVTAIDKHPYPPRRRFPADAVYNGVRPVDALGRPDGWRDAAGRWHDSFVPRYTAFFPEYFLTGIQTETVVRDLSPLTTTVYGTPHGRDTHPPGSSPPSVWLTEAGMDPAGIPPAVLPRFHAKQALRWATAWINRGAARVYYYAVSSPGWGIVAPTAPGGGETLRAVGSLSHALERGAGPITRPRSIRLVAVADSGNRAQFAGDGTVAHPPLYDRDVVGFFPFQVSNGRVVVAAYVMTRDLVHTYRPELPASDPRRYDMPPEWFRLTIAGAAGLRAVGLTDPLRGGSPAFRFVSRRGGRLTVDVALTDSPRLLVLTRRRSGT